MEALGIATRRAIESAGRRAVLAASCSMSHFHWDVEPDLPEDTSREHAFNDHQYRWDMKFLELVRSGRPDELRRFIPEHIEANAGEKKAGSLSWMLAAVRQAIESGKAAVQRHGEVRSCTWRLT